MKEMNAHVAVDRASEHLRVLARRDVLHPVQAGIAQGQRDTVIDNCLTDCFGKRARASEAVYVLCKPVVHESKALAGKVGMRLKLVNSKAHVAASPVVEQEVADRGVLKSNRLKGVIKDVNHGMQLSQSIEYFVILTTEQGG
jgi:hypothetical protein